MSEASRQVVRWFGGALLVGASLYTGCASMSSYWAASAPPGGPGSAAYASRGHLFCGVSLAALGGGAWLLVSLRRKQRPAMACRECGYDLTGLEKLDEWVCPECGHPFDALWAAQERGGAANAGEAQKV